MTIIDTFRQFYDDLTLEKLPMLEKLYDDNVLLIDPVGTHRGLPLVDTYFRKLMANTSSCRFDIHQIMRNENTIFVSWTMVFVTPTFNKGEPVAVDGCSHLIVRNEKIIQHRDYYDMGQMIYEKIPVLGFLVKTIKKKMAA